MIFIGRSKSIVPMTKGFVGMAISNFHGRLGSFGRDVGGYAPKYQAKKNSSITLIAILVAHGIFILIVLNTKTKQSEVLARQPLLQLIQLRPEVSVRLELEKPEISLQANSIHFQLPNIHINDPPQSPISSQSAATYELSDSSDTKHGDVFDPKVRNKLNESESFNRPRTADKAGTWVAIDGRTFVEMGDGNCLVSMQKGDWRDRAVNWGFTQCGKTDSEKTMDRINAEMAARKQVTNKKDTQ